MRDVEAELGSLLVAGTYDRALELALEAYGAELFGFIIHVVGNDSAADDVFAQTAEDLWNGLPRFERRSSVRTWMYALARHAAARYRRSPWQRARTGESAIDQHIAQARSRTAPWLRTEVKDRWRSLRDELDPDDRTLLVLRVDRDLPWNDIALVLTDDEDPTPAALDRVAARLRKRFQLLKTELRERARAAGLVDD